jgi:hypothetical protein
MGIERGAFKVSPRHSIPFGRHPGVIAPTSRDGFRRESMDLAIQMDT